jgi:hypothetical protein
MSSNRRAQRDPKDTDTVGDVANDNTPQVRQVPADELTPETRDDLDPADDPTAAITDIPVGYLPAPAVP